MELTSTESKLAKARAQLVLAHPFIGSIALNMHFKLEEDIPALACTDGTTCWFKPSVVDELSGDELKFLVSHECFHPMLMHNWRVQSRDRKRWNSAGDYVINQLLTDEKIGTMPAKYPGLYDPGIYNAGGMTTEGIYNILPPSDDGNGGGGNDDWDGDIKFGEGTPAEQEAKAQEMKVKVAQAAQAAKMQGALGEGFKRFVDEVLNPKVPWESILQRFVEKAKADERSFARPARRFLSRGMYMPTISGEQMGECVFAVDCSGSVHEEEVAQFTSEIRTVKEDLNPTRIHIVYFHGKVYRTDTFEQDDELEINVTESGGTAFSPIFKAIQEKGITPVACIVLTDLWCGDFGDEPDYPVLWVSNNKDSAPWGEVVMM